MLKIAKLTLKIRLYKYDECAIHNLCCPLDGSGLGAQRWVANLQRQCECFAILMSTATIAEHPSGQDGRKSFLTLAQYIMHKFCFGVCASSLREWDKLCVENVYEDIRVLTRRSRIDPGEPPGIVLSCNICLEMTRGRGFLILCAIRV
ncbi:hypothetical protein Dsin_013530 [Dipteronia sinensis]|uniref:HD-Zip IV C-terminal domain-containing protein n=1 Tax=Dipteronia sinensis TaxID=43782 RepID=A0AAE0AKX0_9ROSI|nr:hypothetical protein Dsin_013530 [Dipteronia sinensis]